MIEISTERRISKLEKNKIKHKDNENLVKRIENKIKTLKKK